MSAEADSATLALRRAKRQALGLLLLVTAVFIATSVIERDLWLNGIKAMAEIGIDISTHTSKHMNDFLVRDVETVITVCGNADQACPVFPGQRNRHHWGFDDPAHAPGDEEAQSLVFRRVRDEIRRVFEAYAAGRLDEAGVGRPHPPAAT